MLSKAIALCFASIAIGFVLFYGIDTVTTSLSRRANRRRKAEQAKKRAAGQTAALLDYIRRNQPTAQDQNEGGTDKSR